MKKLLIPIPGAASIKLYKGQIRFLISLGMFSVLLLFAGQPALAHHAFAGKIPTNMFEGFLSGLAHPVIGVDHFAFVVAVGLLAALKASKGGIFIPIGFVIATLLGTGIHLQAVDLPYPEVIISASVVLFGIMLAIKDAPQVGWLIGAAAVAGIFHGYAYGESIVGAQMTPLVSYLAGFAAIQLVVALIGFQIGKLTLQKVTDQPSVMLRYAGFTICGAGIAFLSSALLK
jgi:urease accessory protein